ncbi:hypothetical protein DB88DRAFT_63929 [Papiliotrema laurentii]|uniref:DUF6534 domain-containing protein n=1 Tax=Papiliotrema laurentii TaxID=5418 RepID=A0AAD9FXH8_PAPLA|nr:hypothetical protein DB88DRAFT_63929 [Papiliotrema laurentii]
MEEAAKAQLSQHIGRNLGPFLLGWIVDAVLFGVMLHQLVLWFANFHTERLYIKITVLWTALLSVITTGYGLYYVWTAFVSGFGLFAQFTNTKKLSYVGLIDVGTILPVQLFYLERAYRLNRESKWIPLMVLPIMITAAVGGLGTFVLSLTLTSVQQMQKLHVWFYLWLAPTAAADVLLTGLIIYGLCKARTGWTETDRLVNRLIRTSFESQLPGTLVALAFLISFGVQIYSLVNVLFPIILTKVYVVSLLAVLNYRFSLHKPQSANTLDSKQQRHNVYRTSNMPHQNTVQVDELHASVVLSDQTDPPQPSSDTCSRREE